MQADKVDLYIMANGKSFPAEQTVFLREKLLGLDENQFLAVQSTELKSPTNMLIISIFVGALGIDRFMLGQVGMGILKLLTGGLCGILALIDWLTISKQTRKYNFEKIMVLIQSSGILESASSSTQSNEFETSSLDSGDTELGDPAAKKVKSSPLPSQAAQAALRAKAVGTIFTESSKGAIGFLKGFVKNPIGAMREKSLSFNESLIFAGAQALGLALTLIVLSYRGASLPILGSLFRGYGDSRIILFLQAIFFCTLLLIVLTAVTLFFGKVVFKGTFEGSDDFRKLIGYVVTAEVPLTLSLIASIIVALIAPPLVLALISAGIVAAIVLESSVFSSVFNLSEDRSAYATISTYSVQILVILLAILLI
jgi:TM2 domain-containing membrane protein YozV